MSRWLTIILILFAPIFSSAQNFAPDGAEWHYTPWCDCLEQESIHFAINAYSTDSIDGFACSMLYWTDIDVIDNDAEIIICENNNQVYFFEEDVLKLLYDFNLTVGDTLIYHIPLVQPKYDLTCCEPPLDSREARAVITAVSDTMIDGKELKVQQTLPIYSDGELDQYIVWNLGNIIERIGSIAGVFGYGNTCCLAGSSGEIRCYTDEEIFAKFVDYDCVSVWINDPTITPIEISPIPATNLLAVSIPRDLQPDHFIIINNTNQILLSGVYADQINIESLPEGIYYLLLDSDKQILGSGKFIKVEN